MSDALRDATEAHYDGGTFAVSARRAGEQDAHPSPALTSSPRAGAWSGETIESMGGEAEVDLDDPDFELFVECREDEAYVFLEKRDGPGGMPLGTQRPVVAMISGGIDSPVAAWQVMRRGCLSFRSTSTWAITAGRITRPARPRPSPTWPGTHRATTWTSGSFQAATSSRNWPRQRTTLGCSTSAGSWSPLARPSPARPVRSGGHGRSHRPEVQPDEREPRRHRRGRRATGSPSLSHDGQDGRHRARP